MDICISNMHGMLEALKERDRQGAEATEKLIKSKDRVKDTAEVFTPNWVVNDMLDLMPPETFEPATTFLEPACGNGNFIVEIFRRKMMTAVRREMAGEVMDAELQTLISMSSIYGIDIAEDNVAETRDRMWQWAFAIGRVWRPGRFGSGSFMSALWQVLDTNFMLGDFINDDGEITFTQYRFAPDLSFVTQETRLKDMLPAPAPAPKRRARLKAAA